MLACEGHLQVKGPNEMKVQTRVLLDSWVTSTGGTVTSWYNNCLCPRELGPYNKVLSQQAVLRVTCTHWSSDSGLYIKVCCNEGLYYQGVLYTYRGRGGCCRCS